MPDMRQRLVYHGAMHGDVLRELDIALARHGADPERIAFDTDIGQFANFVQINQMIRHRVAKIHHRHQRLAARQHAGIVMPREQCSGIRDAAWIVIGKGGGFQA